MIDDKLHIPIQKDIGEYEQKLFGDMSIRTCVCLAGGFATAVLVALASWLWLAIDPSDMTFPIMLATLPFWLAGFWKPHGMPFERFCRWSPGTTWPSATTNSRPATAAARTCRWPWNRRS